MKEQCVDMWEDYWPGVVYRVITTNGYIKKNSRAVMGRDAETGGWIGKR